MKKYTFFPTLVSCIFVHPRQCDVTCHYTSHLVLTVRKPGMRYRDALWIFSLHKIRENKDFGKNNFVVKAVFDQKQLGLVILV